jgi:hypothetical protein
MPAELLDAAAHLLWATAGMALAAIFVAFACFILWDSDR